MNRYQYDICNEQIDRYQNEFVFYWFFLLFFFFFFFFFLGGGVSHPST